MEEVLRQPILDLKLLRKLADEMSTQKLEIVTAEFLAVLASKKISSKEQRIEQLKGLIVNSQLSPSKLELYNQLVPKLESRNMSETEKNVFKLLTDEDEMLRHQRLKYMIELSEISEVPFIDIKAEYGFQPKVHV